MTTLDLRVGALSLVGNPGTSRTLRLVFTADGEPVVPGPVSVWIGGDERSPSDFTGAVEHPAVVAGNEATVTVPIPDSRELLRVTIDSALATIGTVAPSLRGTADQDQTVQVNLGELEVHLDLAAVPLDLAARLEALEAGKQDADPALDELSGATVEAWGKSWLAISEAAAARAALGLGSAATMSPAEIAADPALSATFALRAYGIAPPRSGAWATPAGGSSTGNYVSGDCRAGVLPIPAPCTLDRITCEVTTAAESAVFRMGIWADDGTGRPGALILDAGTVDASTTGIKEITISQALTPGRYWIGGAAQGATLGMRITSPSNVHLSRTLDRPDTVAGVLQAAETAARTLGVTGALPDPFNPGSSQASHPRVAVRFA